MINLITINEIFLNKLHSLAAYPFSKSGKEHVLRSSKKSKLHVNAYSVLVCIRPFYSCLFCELGFE